MMNSNDRKSTKAILCENQFGGVAITVVEERTIDTPNGYFSVTLLGELERMKAADALDALENERPVNTYTIVDKEQIDKKYTDSPFRDAWKNDLTTDIDKAKDIVHVQRRVKRKERFTPLDIQATIPDLAVEAESKRKIIRAENAKIKADVNKATTEAALITQLKKVI